MPRGNIDWKFVSRTDLNCSASVTNNNNNRSPDSYTRLLAAMVAAQDMKVSTLCHFPDVSVRGSTAN